MENGNGQAEKDIADLSEKDGSHVLASIRREAGAISWREATRLRPAPADMNPTTTPTYPSPHAVHLCSNATTSCRVLIGS